MTDCSCWKLGNHHQTVSTNLLYLARSVGVLKASSFIAFTKAAPSTESLRSL